uniref:Uncharacterized protein n=1 Tax=Panagrolaimus sp. ES5 TaxID=591445 RepID=A0AC34F9R1_9BILA
MIHLQFIIFLLFSFIALFESKNSDIGLQEIFTVKKAWESACPLLLSPNLGHYKESNVDLQAVHDAEVEMLRVEEQYLAEEEIGENESFENYLLKTTKINENSQKIVENLKNMPIVDHFCNPFDFALLIDNMNEPVTCEQVCLHCIPGSYPICYAKNRRFPGVARTCLCTYDSENPIASAAFALKSIPVPKIETELRHRGGKSKRELLLNKIAKSILFL